MSFVFQVLLLSCCFEQSLLFFLFWLKISYIYSIWAYFIWVTWVFIQSSHFRLRKFLLLSPNPLYSALSLSSSFFPYDYYSKFALLAVCCPLNTLHSNNFKVIFYPLFILHTLCFASRSLILSLSFIFEVSVIVLIYISSDFILKYVFTFFK